MGSALLGGLVGAGWDPATLTVVEADPDRRAALGRSAPDVAVAAGPLAGDGAVLAVKPVDAETAARALAATGTPRVLSIMAGVPLERLKAWLGPTPAVLRAMPNTPALVGAGVAGLSGGDRATEADFAWAEEILGAVGEVVRVGEPDLDAVTGLSGSGPAYVFLVAEALVEAGIRCGLDPDVSRSLTVACVAGAGRLMAVTREDPAALRAQVTSPGGTTEAGVARLEAHGLREAVAQAVTAATERSRELSRA